MGSYTKNLDLYKADPIVDGNDTFNIDTMMNDNFDKIDTALFHGTTGGTASALTIAGLPETDGQRVQIKLHVNMANGAKLNGKPILTMEGSAITEGAKAGSFLMLAYNSSKGSWYQIGGNISDNTIPGPNNTKYQWGIDSTGVYLQEV